VLNWKNIMAIDKHLPAAMSIDTNLSQDELDGINNVQPSADREKIPSEHEGGFVTDETHLDGPEDNPAESQNENNTESEPKNTHTVPSLFCPSNSDSHWELFELGYGSCPYCSQSLRKDGQKSTGSEGRCPEILCSLISLDNKSLAKF
jgi:hypothetical protein